MTEAVPSADMAEALRVNAGLQPSGDRDAMPVAAQRAVFEEARTYWNADPLAVASVRDDRLQGGMAVRRYLPMDAAAAPLVVYLHGGGWVVGSLDTHDCVARALCHHGGLDVVSLDYPLAPETPFEGIVAAVLQAVRDLAAEMPERRLVLCGDSAGGHLAVCAAARLGPELGGHLAGLVSLYGVLARRDDLPSFAAFGDGRYGLSTLRMRLYWDLLGGDTQAADPLALTAPLPPALVFAAECDVLRDASLAFVERRRAMGGQVTCEIVPGMAHAYMGYGRLLGQVADTARRVGAFVRGL